MITLADVLLPDRLAEVEELQAYEIFAMDGHWHKNACHDPKEFGKRGVTGHFVRLNLRTHIVRDLAVNDYPKEHDRHVLKRLKPKGLRQDIPQGRRVLMVYDPAGEDFPYWARCRKECAVCFLSLVKSNMVYDVLDEMDWDRADARNAGVLADQRIHTRENLLLRVVRTREGEHGREYEFLTNVMDCPPE